MNAQGSYVFYSVNITKNVEEFEVKEVTKEEFYNTIHF